MRLSHRLFAFQLRRLSVFSIEPLQPRHRRPPAASQIIKMYYASPKRPYQDKVGVWLEIICQTVDGEEKKTQDFTDPPKLFNPAIYFRIYSPAMLRTF